MQQYGETSQQPATAQEREPFAVDEGPMYSDGYSTTPPPELAQPDDELSELESFGIQIQRIPGGQAAP